MIVTGSAAEVRLESNEGGEYAVPGLLTLARMAGHNRWLT